MKTGLHTIDSDDEEENALQEKKTKYKKLDMDKVKGPVISPFSPILYSHLVSESSRGAFSPSPSSLSIGSPNISNSSKIFIQLFVIINYVSKNDHRKNIYQP